MDFTEIQTAATLAAVWFAAANASKTSIYLLVAIGMIAVSRNTVADVSLPV